MRDETRTNYPLESNSIVLDVGVYHGDFTNWCSELWGCYVYGFEPVPEFFIEATRNFKDPIHVKLFNYGLGNSTRKVPLHVRADSSTVFFKEDIPPGQLRTIEIHDVAHTFLTLELLHVDLLKINIEGGEYELLDRLVDTNLIQRVRFIQVQFHGGLLPGPGPVDADAERLRVRERLTGTHREQWCVKDGLWESWEKV